MATACFSFPELSGAKIDARKENQSNVFLSHTNEARKQMRNAGRVVANTLGALRSIIKPGVSTDDVSQFCKNHIESQGAVASSLGYFGFPGEKFYESDFRC